MCLRLRTLSIALLSLVALNVAVGAENYLSLSIGPQWPRALLNVDHNRTAWSASVKTGVMFDRRVAFGAGGDFTWNRYVKETEDLGGTLTVTEARRSFMFPVYGFLLFDPLPELLIVHPSIEVNVGYNSLVYKYSNADLAQDDDARYFYGVMARIQSNATYDIGDQVAIIAGIGYTWANTRHDLSGGRFLRRDMSGVGLNAGFRFLM